QGTIRRQQEYADRASKRECLVPAKPVRLLLMLPPRQPRDQRPRQANQALSMRLSYSTREPVSLVLDLQSIRSHIDLQAFRFRLGLVKIVAEHAYGDDQRADDEIQDIAVAGHPSLHRPNELSASVWARTRF